MSATWILRMDEPGTGPRVAIKDLIDVAGTPTTAACAVLARQAEPAERDAACLAGLRAADVAIVGKANLHELACGGTGVNQHFGTPVNPFDPACIPGGSSSGSAVALADGEVDIALGSDTAGSIRNPSACCGTAGLKTTWGRIPLEGVWPLAPSLDTVGPMARDVAGVIEGMALLEPGFAAADAPSPVIGRVRLRRRRPGHRRRRRRRAGRQRARGRRGRAARVGRRRRGRLRGDVPRVLGGRPPPLRAGRRRRSATTSSSAWSRAVTSRSAAYQAARAHRAEWRAELAAAFERAPVLAWPTLAMFPTRIDEPFPNTRRTGLPVNHAGHPSLALPVPTGGRFPASVQLVGPDQSEDLLCATGLVVEAAARTLLTRPAAVDDGVVVSGRRSDCRGRRPSGARRGVGR